MKTKLHNYKAFLIMKKTFIFASFYSPYVAIFQIADVVFSRTFLDQPPLPPWGGYVVCGWPLGNNSVIRYGCGFRVVLMTSSKTPSASEWWVVNLLLYWINPLSELIPVRIAPLGILAPRSKYCWGFLRKLTNSMISILASSQPATSWNKCTQWGL